MSGNVKRGYYEMDYEGMIFQTCSAVDNSAEWGKGAGQPLQNTIRSFSGHQNACDLINAMARSWRNTYEWKNEGSDIPQKRYSKPEIKEKYRNISEISPDDT